MSWSYRPSQVSCTVMALLLPPPPTSACSRAAAPLAPAAGAWPGSSTMPGAGSSRPWSSRRSSARKNLAPCPSRVLAIPSRDVRRARSSSIGGGTEPGGGGPATAASGMPPPAVESDAASDTAETVARLGSAAGGAAAAGGAPAVARCSRAIHSYFACTSAARSVMLLWSLTQGRRGSMERTRSSSEARSPRCISTMALPTTGRALPFSSRSSTTQAVRSTRARRPLGFGTSSGAGGGVSFHVVASEDLAAPSLTRACIQIPNKATPKHTPPTDSHLK
jgi:hypothetical protein